MMKKRLDEELPIIEESVIDVRNKVTNELIKWLYRF